MRAFTLIHYAMLLNKSLCRNAVTLFASALISHTVCVMGWGLSCVSSISSKQSRLPEIKPFSTFDLLWVTQWLGPNKMVYMATFVTSFVGWASWGDTEPLSALLQMNMHHSLSRKEGGIAKITSPLGLSVIGKSPYRAREVIYWQGFDFPLRANEGVNIISDSQSKGYWT